MRRTHTEQDCFDIDFLHHMARGGVQGSAKHNLFGIDDAIIGGVVSGGLGLLGGKSKTQPLETAEQTKTRKFLYNLLQQGPPSNLPHQQVAGLSDAEQQAATMAKQFAASQPEGMGTLKEIAGQSTNPLDYGDYQAIMSEMQRQGQQGSNRLWRSLQAAGGTSASTGGKQMGNYLREITSGITNTLMQGAGLLRQQRFQASEALAQLGESSIMNRLNALSTTGALERSLSQLQKDADYAREREITTWGYGPGLQVAGTILGSTPDYIQQPSILSQLAGPVSNVISASLLSKANKSQNLAV